VTALDINPSIAYRVNENLSIGGGFSVQYLGCFVQAESRHQAWSRFSFRA